MMKPKERLIKYIIVFVLIVIFGPVGAVKVLFGTLGIGLIIGFLSVFAFCIWLAISIVGIEIDIWKKKRLELEGNEFIKWRKERIKFLILWRLIPYLIPALLWVECIRSRW